jgi:hypothetical protein
LMRLRVALLAKDRVIDAVIDKCVDPDLKRSTGERERRWGLRYYAPPPEGLDLVLTVRSTAPLKFRCVDQSYGLPQFPDLQFNGMPDYRTAAPSVTSDTIVVSKSFTF